MTKISDDDTRKLTAIVARLSSPFDGERLAAIAAAEKLIVRYNLRWQDIIGMRPADSKSPKIRTSAPDFTEMDSDDANELAERCFRSGKRFNTWTLEFLESAMSWTFVTPAREAKLREIAERLGVA